MVTTESNSDRYCQSCCHSLRGLASRKCPECGRDFDPRDPRTTSPYPYSAYWSSAAWFACGLIVIGGVLAGLSLFASAIGYYPLIDPSLFRLCAILIAPFMLVGLLACVFRRLPIGRRWRICGIAFPAIFLSVVWTHWPLRLSLALHKPALNRIADQAQPTATTAGGQVGMFRFRQVRVIHNGNVGFQLTGGAGGGTYLVRCVTNADRVWYNTNWEMNLGGNWYLVFED